MSSLSMNREAAAVYGARSVTRRAIVSYDIDADPSIKRTEILDGLQTCCVDLLENGMSQNQILNELDDLVAFVETELVAE